MSHNAKLSVQVLPCWIWQMVPHLKNIKHTHQVSSPTECTLIYVLWLEIRNLTNWPSRWYNQVGQWLTLQGTELDIAYMSSPPKHNYTKPLKNIKLCWQQHITCDAHQSFKADTTNHRAAAVAQKILLHCTVCALHIWCLPVPFNTKYLH